MDVSKIQVAVIAVKIDTMVTFAKTLAVIVKLEQPVSTNIVNSAALRDFLDNCVLVNVQIEVLPVNSSILAYASHANLVRYTYVH